MPCGRGP